jgi:hypothetical protein
MSLHLTRCTDESAKASRTGRLARRAEPEYFNSVMSRGYRQARECGTALCNLRASASALRGVLRAAKPGAGHHFTLLGRISHALVESIRLVSNDGDSRAEDTCVVLKSLADAVESFIAEARHSFTQADFETRRALRRTEDDLAIARGVLHCFEREAELRPSGVTQKADAVDLPDVDLAQSS